MAAPAIGIHGFTMVLEYIAIDPPMNMRSATISNPMKKYLAALTDFFMILVNLYYKNVFVVWALHRSYDNDRKSHIESIIYNQ